MTSDPSRVHDELQIRSLTARFAEAAVLRDYAAFAETWAADGVWRITPPIDRTFVGRDEIAAAIPNMLALWEWFVQLPVSGTIAFAGDEAYGRWLMTERARPVHGDGGHFNHGLYDDHYVRERGEWRFRSRTYHYLYLDDSAPAGRGFRLETSALAARPRGAATIADIERWLAAWNSHDIDRILALFDEDMVMYQPQNPKPLGKADVARFFGLLFSAFPDIRFERSAEPTIDGLQAASWERVTGTMTGEFLDPATGARLAPTGRSFDIPGAMRLVYRPNGRLASVHIYWDRLLFSQQLGLLPGPASASR